MNLHRYVVWPRPTGDGFNLDGPRLPYGLWHTTEFNAIDFAHYIMRDTGGQVTVLDSRGYPIVTEVVPGTGVASQYGAQVAFPPRES